MLPLNLYARVRISLCKLHTRPRVQRAPGLPCTLCLEEGGNSIQTSGALRREKRIHMDHLHCERCEAIHASASGEMDCFLRSQ